MGLKCPFCQQELVYDSGIEQWCCDKCHLSGGYKLWEALIDTQKKLEKAKWWLNEIVKNHRFTPISTAEKALAEINKTTKGGKND